MPKLSHKKISLDEMIEQITHLPPEKQLQIVSRITYNLSREKLGHKLLDIRKLRGLGKDIWQGIDAQEYVNKERESWNG